MIPISDPKGQFTVIQDELLEEIEKVLRSGQYILGPKVTELEEKVAQKLGVSEAIAVANGTDALVLTLLAFGIGKGDEVITTPFTFFATAEAIESVGATPVFVDVDEQTFNMDPRQIEEKITPRTKAILLVHLFGQSASMEDINNIAKKHGLYVIEDACQAFGASYKGRPIGSLGDAACFSFFPTKNLSTMGDGGMVTTSNKTVANKIRTLRAHGSVQKYYHDEIGFNSRLDEIHAAILLVCLKYIGVWNKERVSLANRYVQNLKDVSSIKLTQLLDDGTHVYHLFCIQTDRRDELMEYLANEKISTGVYYPLPLHLQNALKHLGYQKGDFPVTEMLSRTLLAIPLYPSLTVGEQDHVIDAIKRFGVKPE